MADLFRVLGGIAGLAGIAAGVVLLIFRGFIQRTLLAKLESHHAYNLLRLIIIFTFAFGVFVTTIWALDRGGAIGPATGSGGITDAKSEPSPTSAPSVEAPAQPDIAVGQKHSQNGDEVIYQRTLAIIADELEVPVTTLKPETSLYSGKLNMVSLVVHLDAAFNISIPDEVSFRFRKVQDVTDYMQKTMRMRPNDPR